MPLSLTLFALSLGATARITRFLTADYLFRKPREWAIRWLGPDHDLPYLLGCGWCASIWVSAGVFTAAWFYGHTAWFLIASGALSASYLYAVASAATDPQ